MIVGCRSASINLEARSLQGWSTSRHCVVAKLQDLTIDQFRNIKTKAGALLIILQKNLSELSNDDKQVVSVLSILICCDISKYFSTS